MGPNLYNMYQPKAGLVVTISLEFLDKYGVGGTSVVSSSFQGMIQE
jgi:hypothetical protein